MLGGKSALDISKKIISITYFLVYYLNAEYMYVHCTALIDHHIAVIMSSLNLCHQIGLLSGRYSCNCPLPKTNATLYCNNRGREFRREEKNI